MRNTGEASGVSSPMGFQVVGVVVANLIVLLATRLAFDEWRRQSFGYLDLDMVGLSGVLWAPLVVVATLMVAIGFSARHIRWIAASAMLGLAFILVDHGFGALRDGEVSTAGAVIGVLMVVQLMTLVLSLLVASRRGRPATVAASLVLAIGAAVLISGGLNAARTFGAEPRANLVRSWLNALANDPLDRGWSYLGSDVQVQANRDDYLADAEAVDWSSFRWKLEDPHDHDGAWSVSVLVDGGLSAAPDLFFDHQIVFPHCVDDQASGFGVWVEVPLIGAPSLGGGGLSDRRTCSVSNPEQFVDPVTWGDQPKWTGFALEVWNRTTVDLYLIDRHGVRIELPACGRASISELDLSWSVEVRAEGGYVFAFGTEDGSETTTFMVILAGEPSMNGAPPVEPLPPCEGEPDVQAGV
ncbi:MAG: hypothetical protein M3406_14970 [Chloroflexota bacterium]|nr:hypothetical protein [Chloroflexota bacterium]